LTRLNEIPSRNCALVDITCDSDGRIARFIGDSGVSQTVPLHELSTTENYYVGLFLTGAYQDVMGDMHNLFGRLNEAHVSHDASDPSGFFVEEFIRGSAAAQVLSIMQYNPDSMASRVKGFIDTEVGKGSIRSRDGVKLVDFYESCLERYTYLRFPDPGAPT
jgi:arginine decarboxylase